MLLERSRGRDLLKNHYLSFETIINVNIANDNSREIQFRGNVGRISLMNLAICSGEIKIVCYKR